MIEIQDIKNNSKEDILLLLKKEKQPFEISIPKSTRQFYSSNEDIAMEYSSLTYFGELLFNASTEFDYDLVDPTLHESILFTITTDKMELLASVIYEISLEFCNEHGETEFFYDVVMEFIENIDKGKVIPACNFFYEVYKDFE